MARSCYSTIRMHFVGESCLSSLLLNNWQFPLSSISPHHSKSSSAPHASMSSLNLKLTQSITTESDKGFYIRNEIWTTTDGNGPHGSVTQSIASSAASLPPPSHPSDTNGQKYSLISLDVVPRHHAIARTEVWGLENVPPAAPLPMCTNVSSFMAALLAIKKKKYQGARCAGWRGRRTRQGLCRWSTSYWPWAYRTRC